MYVQVLVSCSCCSVILARLPCLIRVSLHSLAFFLGLLVRSSPLFLGIDCGCAPILSGLRKKLSFLLALLS